MADRATPQPSVPESWDDPEPDRSQDPRKMRNLLRALAIIMGIPAWSISLAYLLFEDPARHVPHLLVYGAVAVATVVLFVMAPRLGERWTKE